MDAHTGHQAGQPTEPRTGLPTGPRKGRPLAERVQRAAEGLTVAVGGFVLAILAALVSRLAWRPGPVTVPWGLALGVVSAAGVVVLAWGRRPSLRLLAATGWLVGLGYLLAPRAGEFVLAADGLGWGFIVGPTATIVASVLILGSRR
jgi:hypothetical protein